MLESRYVADSCFILCRQKSCKTPFLERISRKEHLRNPTFKWKIKEIQLNKKENCKLLQYAVAQFV